jgi:hypothetical protein
MEFETKMEKKKRKWNPFWADFGWSLNTKTTHNHPDVTWRLSFDHWVLSIPSTCATCALSVCVVCVCVCVWERERERESVCVFPHSNHMISLLFIPSPKERRFACFMGCAKNVCHQILTCLWYLRPKSCKFKKRLLDQTHNNALWENFLVNLEGTFYW